MAPPGRRTRRWRYAAQSGDAQAARPAAGARGGGGGADGPWVPQAFRQRSVSGSLPQNGFSRLDGLRGRHGRILRRGAAAFLPAYKGGRASYTWLAPFLP